MDEAAALKFVNEKTRMIQKRWSNPYFYGEATFSRFVVPIFPHFDAHTVRSMWLGLAGPLCMSAACLTL